MRPALLSHILGREFRRASVGRYTPVMLWGAPGVGKSQMIADIAQRHDGEVYDDVPLAYHDL